MLASRFAAVVVCMAVAPDAVGDSSPWSVGVTDEQKAAAQEHLDAGNALLLERQFTGALAEYAAAIAQWDHPAIRVNVVRCLIQLDRMEEAASELKIALAHGATPFEDGVFTEALGYQKLLAAYVGDLAVSCRQPGVEVTVDGSLVATCPATVTRQLRAGRHQLVGAGRGLATQTWSLVVAGGERQEVEVSLDTLASRARTVHRWPTWIPWAIAGAGLAVGAIGGVVQLSAMSDRDSFDRTVNQNCRDFCTRDELIDLEVEGLDRSARRKSIAAVGMLGAGALTVAVGAVIVYLNRGRTVYAESSALTPVFSTTADAASVGIAGGF